MKKLGIVGAPHGGKADIEIWEEFNENWQELTFESERLLAEYENRNIEDMGELTKEELSRRGEEKE